MSSPPRIFLPSDSKPLSSGDRVLLSKEQLHHLTRVLRLRDGGKLEAVDTAERCAWSGVLVVKSGEFTAEQQIDTGPDRSELSAVKTLIAGLCRGQKNDLICEKATELGVEQIIFWECDRSVKRAAGSKAGDSALARWRRIAESAAAQSKRLTLPKLALAQDFDEVLEIIAQSAESNSDRLFASLSPKAPFLRKYEPTSKTAHLLIGPEGDLSEREIQHVTQSGFQHISLGPGVLRTETAAVAAIAMVDALWGFS